MTIYPILEGMYNVSKEKIFVYLDENKKDLPGLNFNVRPFLIEVEDDLILIDCGFGAIHTNKTYFIEKLNSYGFSEQQVTKILVSHLHKDHINGLGTIENNNFSCYFPNAKIYIQEREMDYALQAESPSYSKYFLEKLKYFHNIIYLKDDFGKISNEITFEVVGGHVPFQQVFWIKENEETAFFGADNLPQLNYLKYHAAFKNDDDGTKAMNDRMDWAERASNEHWTVLFYHGKKTAFKKF